MDLEEASVLWWPELQQAGEDHNFEVMAISAVSREGVRQLLYRVKQMLEKLPPTPPVTELPVIHPERDEDAFDISREQTADGLAWRVSGRKIERIAAMTYWEFAEAANRFQAILEAMGIREALEKAGVEPGDSVLIGEEVLEWSD